METTKGYQTARYYYVFPKTKELITYRQAVGRDMESEKLCSSLQGFCRRLKQSRSIHNLSLKCEGAIPSATYHLQSATLYREALSCLKRDLEECNLTSEGMRTFYGYVCEQLTEFSKSGFVAALERANSFFSELSFRLFMDPDKLMVEESTEAPKNYLAELAKLLYGEETEADVVMRDIFPDPLEPTHFESVLVGLLKKSKPEVFQELRAFHERFPEFYTETLLRFEEEVQFYLGFQKFKRRTENMGYPMCVPAVSESQEFMGKGVYDIALVWKQADRNYEVVSNDFSMSKKPSFFVVTGPNQGGKTTFARSVGQAVYFSLMGLPANAEGLAVPLFGGISTHFETEESMQSNSGKLKEEINRLLPMLTRIQNRNHFVILNELFTTATTHDAMVMGRRVMEFFLERECHGIYVTHIQELAKETEQIVSLVAQLEPGQEVKRTYRMLRMPAQGHGYSDALVKKFSLTYEEIVRRLP